MNANTLPGRGFPQVTGTPVRGLPARYPGGADGPISVPSRLADPRKLGGSSGGTVAGGIAGGGALDRRRGAGSVLDNLVPSIVGKTSGWWNRLGLVWARGSFDNTGPVGSFLPYDSPTPSWTSNRRNLAAPQPGSPIPTSRHRYSYGALQRGYAVDAQLYPWSGVRIRWPHQKPMPRRIKGSIAQPGQTSPHNQKLTRWAPARSFGATTPTLTSPRLTNTGAAQTGQTFGAY